MNSTTTTLQQLNSLVYKRLGIDCMYRSGDTLMATSSDVENVNMVELANLAGSTGCSSIAVLRPDGVPQRFAMV